jgi:Thioredoxin.
MTNLILITRRNCEACSIMLHNVADVLDETNTEVTLRVRHSESLNVDTLIELNIKNFPTILIKQDGKEVGRIEGTYPVDYIKEIINKL